MVLKLEERIHRIVGAGFLLGLADKVVREPAVGEVLSALAKAKRSARRLLRMYSVDDIFRDPDRFAGRHVKCLAADVMKKSMHSDIRFSLDRFLHHMGDVVGLGFAGAYVRSDNALFSVETDRNSGKLVQDRTLGFYDGLLTLDSPKYLELPYTSRLEVPLLHRGVRHGALVFEKDRFRNADLSLLVYCSSWLSQHLDNAVQTYAWRKAALEDHLTGLFNRRHFDSRLPRMILEAHKSGKPLSVVLLDLDHFKDINDTRGHAAGDDALRMVAELLRSKFRAEDIVRYGGEEFAIMLYDTPYAVAKQRADDLLIAFTGLGFPEKITATMGVASTMGDPGSGKSYEGFGGAKELIEIADSRLYDAKTFRNAVCCLDDDPLTGLPNVRHIRDGLGKYLDTDRRRRYNVAVFIYNVQGMNQSIRRFGQEQAWNLFRDAVLSLNGKSPEFESLARVHRRDEVIGYVHSTQEMAVFEQDVREKAERTLRKLREAAPLDFILGVVLYNGGDVAGQYAMWAAADPSMLMSSAQQVVDDAKRFNMRLLIRPYSQ